jgi:hypothetical protein
MIITQQKPHRAANRLSKYPRLSAEEKDRYYAEIVANCERIGDCLVWKGATTAKGYGVKKFGHRPHSVSRFMLAYTSRESMNTDDDACHKKCCLFRACCNPDHLFWGTHSTNAAHREDAKRRRAELPVFLANADPALFLPVLIAMLQRMTGQAPQADTTTMTPQQTRADQTLLRLAKIQVTSRVI